MALCAKEGAATMRGFTSRACRSKAPSMRAEAQNHIDKIEQALALLRRFL
jgi:hypothetical protein